MQQRCLSRLFWALGSSCQVVSASVEHHAAVTGLQPPFSPNLLPARPELQGCHRCRGQKAACQAILAASWALVGPPPPLLLPCWPQTVGQQPLQPVLVPCLPAWTALRRSPPAGPGLLALRSWAPANRGSCASAGPAQHARACHLSTLRHHILSARRDCAAQASGILCVLLPSRVTSASCPCQDRAFPDAVHMHEECCGSQARLTSRAVHCFADLGLQADLI